MRERGRRERKKVPHNKLANGLFIATWASKPKIFKRFLKCTQKTHIHVKITEKVEKSIYKKSAWIDSRRREKKSLIYFISFAWVACVGKWQVRLYSTQNRNLKGRNYVYGVVWWWFRCCLCCLATAALLFLVVLFELLWRNFNGSTLQLSHILSSL